MDIKQLNETLLKALNESNFKTVYLVYEREYVTGDSRDGDDIVSNIREYAEIFTEKALVEYAEDKRQDFIELEDYSDPIDHLDIALNFLDMAGYEVMEMTLID